MASEMELGLHCPRCNSSHTKFCYYNNYSLSQPRYFCKACQRYWTKGGALRNVPVGGGCRRSRRRRRPHSPKPPPMRPDLVLDGIAGNVDQTSSTNHGSKIDLASLYNKFLNHRSSSEDFRPSDQLQLIGISNKKQITNSMEEFGCDLDSTSSDDLPVVSPPDGFINVLSLNWQEQGYTECWQAPEIDSMNFHYQDVNCNESYKAYFSSLEALVGLRD